MLPNEVYFEALQFCTRIELAKSVSFVNRRFNAMAEIKMFEEGEHNVQFVLMRKMMGNDQLEIYTTEKQFGNENVLSVTHILVIYKILLKTVFYFVSYKKNIYLSFKNLKIISRKTYKQ